jgi:hypothetical protein
VFSHWRSILLDIPWVVVEWTIPLSGLKSVCILDHLFVEPIKAIMRYHILNNDEAILMEAAHRNL